MSIQRADGAFPTLEEAAEAAANVGAEAMNGARADIEAIAESLHLAARHAQEAVASLEGTSALFGFQQAITALTAEVATRGQALRRMAANRAATAGRLRVAAFGRTHVGKSTLVEAMVCGDGATVSDGRTGFTRTAKVYQRGALDVIDLPGLEAFGEAGAADERVAEEAVLAADVVMLVFDTNNQKVTEFEKIADWVTRYNKPLVAVLNVLGEPWRRPEFLVTAVQRRGFQVQVEQHAAHVRRRLAALGLEDFVIVALQAQRALFARSEGPWRQAHSARARENLRQKYGREALLEMSNFPRLATYLAALVHQGGPRLRIAALAGELAGSASAAGDVMADARLAAERLAREALGPQVEVLMRLVGRDRVSHDVQRLLVGARGGVPLPGTPSGDIVAYARDLAAARVGELERAALAESRRIVDAEEELSGAAFGARVLPQAKAAEVLASIEADLQAHVRQHLAGVRAELSSDLSSVLDGAGTSGEGGFWKRAGGWALGIGATLAGVGLLFAELSFPPLLIATAVIAFFGWLGRKLRVSAQRDRAGEKRRNLERSERAVRDACGKLRSQVEQRAAELAARVAADVLLPVARGFVALHRVSTALRAQETRVRNIAARRGSPPPLAEIQRAARGHVLGAASVPVGADPEAWIFVGGDWAGEAGAASTSAQIEPAPRLSRLSPLPPATRSDLTTIDRALLGLHVDDQSALEPERVAALALGGSTRRRLVLAGEYNTAKSSLVRRLLLAEGLPVPASLRVAAHPETASVTAYGVGPGVELVDTPGLGSGLCGHDEAAREAAAGAPAGLLCLAPSLFTGPAEFPAALLAGSTAAGTAPGGDRWSVLVTRADALGTSPVDDPAGWCQLREQKRSEVQTRLEAWGVAGVQVSFCAADPFQRASGNDDATLADYAGTGDWDGFEDVRGAIHAALDGQSRAALVAAGVRSLGPAFARRRVEVEGQRLAANASSSLDDILRGQIERGAQVLRGHKAQLRQAVESAVDALAAPARTSIIGAGDSHALIDALEAHKSWPEGVPRAVAPVQVELTSRLANTLETLEARIGRTLGSATAKLAAEHGKKRRGTREAPRDTRKAREFAGGAGGAARAATKAAEKMATDPKLLREEIKVAVGAMKKWKPWEATKLAKRFNVWAPKVAKFGRALGALVVVIEVVTLVIEEKRRREFEATKQEALRELSATVRQIAQGVLQGDGGEGPEARLEQIASTLDAEASRLVAQAAQAGEERDALDRRIAAINVAIDDIITASGSS